MEPKETGITMGLSRTLQITRYEPFTFSLSVTHTFEKGVTQEQLDSKITEMSDYLGNKFQEELLVHFGEQCNVSNNR